MIEPSPSTAAVLLRNAGRILLATLIVILLAAAVWLIVPGRYTARTALYIPQPQVDARLQAMAAQLPGGFLGLSLDGGPDTRMVNAVLESRSLRDSVERRFGRVPDIAVRRTPESAIVVQVTHRDADLARRVAAAYPELVNALVTQIGLDLHERRQDFLRRQLIQAQEELYSIEQRLVAFQTTSNAPELEEQARQTIDAAAQLQRRVVEKEIEVAQLRRTLTENHPALRAAEAELVSWRGQLARLSAGTPGGGDIFVPLQAGPELRADAYRLAREFRAQEQVFVSLRAALEQAELDGSKALPVVSVIDAPVLPDSPSPGLLAVLAFAAMVGLVGSIVWTVAAHRFALAQRDPAFARQWQALRSRVR